MTNKTINVDRLLEQANNVHIDIEKIETIQITTGKPMATSFQILVRDDSDEVIAAVFKGMKDVFTFLQTNSYRDILLHAERPHENLEKYLRIAETSGGFFFSGEAYRLDEIEHFHVETLDVI